MGGYVREIVIKKEWDGDNATLVLRPIAYGDMLSAMAYLKEGKISIPANEVEAFFGRLKPYVISITGLKTFDAKDVTADELFGSAYFFGLLIEVIAEWLAKAAPANPPSPGASLNA